MTSSCIFEGQVSQNGETTMIVSKWLQLIKQKPSLFNSITGCGLCASSDLLAQSMEPTERTTAYRIRRVCSAGLLGAFFGGLVYPAAYARLDAIWKGTHFRAVLQKSIVEIATVGIFVNSTSMMSRGLLVGRDLQDVLDHVVSEMPVVTLNDVRVWLPYNMIAFSLIPIAIRPTTTLMMEAGWQTYISLKSNDYSGSEEVSWSSDAVAQCEERIK